MLAMTTCWRCGCDVPDDEPAVLCAACGSEPDRQSGVSASNLLEIKPISKSQRSRRISDARGSP
jgi:Zn finger protein HypA/HybF involved in hydrogenase expression